MKINNGFGANGVLKAYTNQNKQEKLDKVDSKSQQRDKVEISSEAKELLGLRQRVSQLPIVNSERVAEIKAKIEKGQYQVSAQELAEKMLGEIHRK